MDQIVAAFAAMLAGKSADYQEGYAAGYEAAVEQVEGNRDHFMRLLGVEPFETHDEAIKRIYATPWNEQHKDGTVVDQVRDMLRDSVDLYVVLPRFWEDKP